MSPTTDFTPPEPPDADIPDAGTEALADLSRRELAGRLVDAEKMLDEAAARERALAAENSRLLVTYDALTQRADALEADLAAERERSAGLEVVVLDVRQALWALQQRHADRIDELARLRADAEAALAQAKADGRGKVVNWADLSVTEVRHWTRDDGDSGYDVFISEANCQVLEHAVYQALRERWPSVEVRTEW